ncbi:MAG: NAD(P)H-hydrate dehydratase [Candidatus Bathyarchaeota archaeon]|nr:NAD(P)H-hydrate dehydratase [Candidatus Termiticorpusculum sp.]
MQTKNLSHHVSSSEMRAIETNSEYYGVSLLQLMENAGGNIAKEIQKRFTNTKKVTFFCGLGGNGGDGFVAARHLLTQGYLVTIILAGKSKDINHPSAIQNWNALKPVMDRIHVVEVSDSSAIPTVETDVIVDALLGTGTKGKLKMPILQMVNVINSLKGFKIAVDVPTGIDSDTGEVLGEAVKADLTITFYKSKEGLEKAKQFVGVLEVKDIGLPIEFERFAGPGDVTLVGKQRFSMAHKGDFGRLLVVGGSNVFSGAPTLVSIAALRTGIDIAYTASPEKTAHVISAMSPDLISVKLHGDSLNPDNVAELEHYLDMVDAVVMGPGLGLNSETCEFVKLFVNKVEKAGKALLLDADGLKAFAKFKRSLHVPLVLTPHGGEYAILTGQNLPEDLEDKVVMIQKTAKELNAVLLVKGKVDIICSPSRVKLNFTGNAGMTVGGTGDVLSGIVGGLLAQKTSAFEAAVAGAFVSGACGDFVASEIGFHMVATDILDWIPKVFVDPMSHLKVQ